ncbi:MAG TPA: diguanylate cyclase [Candidatus Limnocylindrales bacterium]|nr:diguanylate cyclase [Candidatus Limnocylindrales bacterium]
MDQLTATALIVALVINFVVLALAFGWAIRNRSRTEPRQASPSARGEPRPWWLDQAGRAEATVGAEGALPAAATDLPRTAQVAHPAGADHSRGTELLEALEPAAAWRSILGREATRVTRYRRAATVVIADLEGTDRLASRLGGESVDRLLPAVAGTLRRETRATDRVVRLANARFGILLPETDEVAAINWVERVREATDLWLDASAVSLRLAFGWAELGPDGDVDAVIALAYERLDAERRALHPATRIETAPDATRPGPDRPSGGRSAVVASRPAGTAAGSRPEADRSRSSLAAS